LNVLQNREGEKELEKIIGVKINKYNTISYLEEPIEDFETSPVKDKNYFEKMRE
jgi:hypothetical protein